MQTEYPILGIPVENVSMGVPKLQPCYTVDEYLKIDRESQERYLYLDGEIFMMAGESDAHGLITFNLSGLLHSQLKGKTCSGRTKDTKVRSGLIRDSGSSKSGMFCYPDILVICGDPEFHDSVKDVILNPKAIFEVLSPTTEAFDRGEKFTRYQTWNPTLTDYVLVSQDQPQIEHFHKKADGDWVYHRYTGLEATVVIPSIECSLKLADVYDRVVFAERE